MLVCWRSEETRAGAWSFHAFAAARGRRVESGVVRREDEWWWERTGRTTRVRRQRVSVLGPPAGSLRPVPRACRMHARDANAGRSFVRSLGPVVVFFTWYWGIVAVELA